MAEGGALREIAARFGIEFDDSALKRGNESVNAGVGLLRQFGAVLAGAEIVRGLHEFVHDFTEMGSAINDASDNLGVTTRNLQELQFAAGQAGVRGQQLNAALLGLSNNLEQARTGGGRAASAFRLLGVHVTDASGHVRGANDVMSDIARGMDRVTDPARRVAIASDIFGRAGRRLVGVLHEGSGGLSEMRQQFQDLGAGMSDEAVKAADDYGDSLERLRLAQLGLKSMIGAFLLPALTSVTDWASHAIAWFHRLTEGTHILGVTAVAVGAMMAAAALPVLAAWSPVLLPFLETTVAVGALILVIEDLWTAFHGGDSVTSRLVDMEFGANAMRDAIQGVKLAWIDVQIVVLGLMDTVDRFIEQSATIQRAVSWITGRNQAAAATANAQDARERADQIANLRSEAASLGSPVVQGAPVRGYRPPRKVRDRVFEGASEYATAAVGSGYEERDISREVTRIRHVEHHTHSHKVEINVHGAANPQEVARRVIQMQRDLERTRHDQNHPRTAVDE